MPEESIYGQLAQEITTTTEEFELGTLDWYAYSQKAVMLAARKMDMELTAGGSEPVHVQTLESLLDYDVFQHFDLMGIHGEPARVMGTGKGFCEQLDAIQSVIETQFGMGFTPEPVMDEMYISGPVKGFAHEKALTILRQHFPDNIKALFMVQLLAKISERRVHRQYEHLINVRSRTTVAPDRITDYWYNKVGEIRTNVAFAQKAFTSAHQKSTEIFGDQGGRVLQAFDAIMFLQANTFDRSHQGMHRNTILQFLKDGNIDAAEIELTRLVQLQPSAFSKRAKQIYAPAR